MVIEFILIILGVLTLLLGIWNIIVGAYLWGILFAVGGIWSTALGIIYIKQIKRNKEKEKKRLQKQSSIDLSESVPEEIDEPEVQVEEFEIDSNLFDEVSEFDKAMLYTDEAVPTPRQREDDLDNSDTAQIVDIIVELEEKKSN